MENASPAADAFTAFTDPLRDLPHRREVAVAVAPAPSRLAPLAYALNCEVTVDDELVGGGRLVILHSPGGQESWDGDTRVVAHAFALVEKDVADDPVLNGVGWSWLEEAIASRQLEVRALGGTTTKEYSTSFGSMSARPDEGKLQVRASWTAELPTIRQHALAWTDLIETACGLPPLIDGVHSLPVQP